MIRKETVLARIRSKEKQLKEFGVREVGLFGSVHNETHSEDSDIDLLMDFYPGRETFDNFMKAYDLLEELFKEYKVDISTRNGLSPYIAPFIMEDITYA